MPFGCLLRDIWWWFNYIFLVIVLLVMTCEPIRLTIRHPLTDVTLFAALVQERLTLRRIMFGDHEHLDGAVVDWDKQSRLSDWGCRISEALSGRESNLSDIPLDLRGYTVFRLSVLQSARRIPWGSTISYAELARCAGYPGAFRAVGSVMRKNDFPLVVPCHRVICSGGALGGFSGAVGGRMVDLKRALLQREKK